MPSIAVIAGRRRRRGNSGGGAVITDTFTRANSAVSLGSTESGSAGVLAWSAGAGTWGIDTNQAYIATSSGGSDVASVNAGVSDCTVSIQMGARAGSAWVVGRLSDANNLILVEIRATDIAMFKRVAGAFTQLGSAATITVASGDTVSLRMSGNSLIALVNGVTQITSSDAFNSTATRCGIGMTSGNSTQRFDNFSVTVP